MSHVRMTVTVPVVDEAAAKRVLSVWEPMSGMMKSINDGTVVEIDTSDDLTHLLASTNTLGES